MVIWVFLWCCSFVALVLRLRCSSSVDAVLVWAWFIVCWLLGLVVLDLWCLCVWFVVGILWLGACCFMVARDCVCAWLRWFAYSCSFVGCVCGFVVVGFLVGYRL